MIKYIITSTILSLFFLVQSIAQVTTISGEVKNPDFYSISFQWENDVVSGIVKENVIALNGANKFSTPIDISESTMIHIKYGTNHKNIFIEPGDDLKINFDANHFDYTFLFSGKGSENNKLLDAFEKEFEKYTDNFFIFEMAHKTNQEYRDYMNDVHSRMWAFYQKNSLSGISYHFRNYLKSEIDYKWAYNLLRYRYENPRANLQPEPIVLPRTYYTFLDEVQVQNPSGLKNEYYHKFIDEYLLYRKESGASALKKFSVRVESNSLTLRSEPKSGTKIDSVNKGDILEYLKERSKETSQVYTRGKRMTTKWIKVRTPNGQIGWIIEGGIDFVRSSDDTSLGALARNNKYNNAGKHLKGTVLEYYIAKELHRSVRQNQLPYQKEDFNTFLNTAQNKAFKSCIENDYNKKFGGGEDNLVINSSAGSPATSPTTNPTEPTPPNPTSTSDPANTSNPTTSTSKNYNLTPKRTLPRGTNYAAGFSKSTELKGRVEHPTAKSIDIVFYKDKFAFEEESFNLPLNARNEFNLVFNISGPTVAKLIYDGSEVEIFLEPGDALEMAFEGKDFVSSINFGGDSGEQNNFLSQFNNEFKEYNEDYVYREIVGKQHSSYRFLMDKIRRKKWNYYQQYDIREKRDFSAGFTKYIAAEIDYWWAYNLLRYHWEHPAANGLAFPMKISAGYYSFLGKVMVSNDDAIASKSYLSFVTLYLKLMEDNTDGNITHQIRQGTFKNKTANEEVMSSPGGNTSLTFLFRGETVKYLNVKSPNTTSKLVNGVIKTDHWYQVATNDGYTGWVFGAGGTIEGVENEVVDVTEKFRTIEEEKEVVKTVAVVNVDRLRIRKEPDLPSAIGFANEGDELVYLGRKSSQRYTFTLRGQTFNDHFYKIEAADGQTGWVFGGGMELQERKTKEKVYRTEPVAQTTAAQQSGNGGTEMYLTGRALYYTKANDIYWKCKGAEPEEIKKEVDRFINSNPYKEYDVAIQTAYDDAIRRIYSVPVKKDDSAEIAAKAAAEKEAKRLADEKKAADAKEKADEKRIADEKRVAAVAKREAELREKTRLDNIQLAKEAKEKEEIAATKAKEEAKKLEDEKIRKEKETQRLADLKAAKLKAEKEAQELADAEAREAAQAEADKIRAEEAQAKLDAKIAADKEVERLAALEAQRKEDLRLEKLAEKERIAEEKAAAKADRKAVRLAEIQRRKDEKERLAEIQKKKKEEERLARERADAEKKRLADLAEAKRKKDEAAATEGTASLGGTSVEVSEPINAQPSISVAPKTVRAPRVDNTFKVDRITECVLDGMERGIPKEEAEKQCVEFFKDKPETTVPDTQVISITTTPTAKVYTQEERKVITPAELFGMIDMTPMEVPKTAIMFTGRIANHGQKDAKIILYPDPVSMKEVVYNLYVKPDGTFSTKLRLSEPTIGKLVYGSRLVELYIEPGDGVKISFDAKNFLNSLAFTGQGGEHNKFLKDLRVDFTNQDKEAKGKVFSESNPKAFKKFLTKIRKEKIAYYNIRLKDFSYKFSQYAKASIDYWYAYNLINYRWEHPLNHHQHAPMAIHDKSFYDFMDEIPLNNPGALPNEYYAYYIDVFLDDRSKEPENKGLTKVELATRFLEGEVKFFYQAKKLGVASRNGELSNVIFDVKTFMDACTYQPYKEYMKNALRESNTILPGMQAPDFNLVDVNGKKVTLSDYKGKVIYLDFWATWCTSCIRQISNTSEMRRQLAGKDIAFVYVSLDNTEYDWKRFVTKNRVTGTHLFSEGALSSVIANDYGVKQLPTAFIIDKDGKIVESKSKIVKNNSMNGSSTYTLKEQLSNLLSGNK